MDSSIHTEAFKISCIACQLFTSLVLNLPAGTTRESVGPSTISMCVSMLGQPEKICKGMINGNIDVLFDIKEQGIPITPERICGTILENENCANKRGPQVEWKLDMELGSRPDEMSDPSESSDNGDYDSDISIIQITDIHYDPQYSAGRSAACSDPLCCRSDQPFATSSASRATKYGHYNYCDVPLDVLRSALEDIRKRKHIALVYMTGDLVSHALWETSRESNLNVMKTVAELFREYLGYIPVIPVIGNHEPHPSNVFAPYFIKGNSSSTWLYKGFMEHWGWSLTEEAKQTFLKGGYYTLLTQKKLRIVVLNTNVYQKLNWWNVAYPVDMNDQLTWLATILMKAEKNQEKIHILSHIPPGSEDTMQVFQREYRKLVERFQHTIAAEFNGHSHYEDFTLFYDTKNQSRAHSVAFNGGSITSYYNVNPNYRVYRVNNRTWEVTDYDSYSYNISDIGDDSPPTWKKLYSFVDEYEVGSMSPEDLGNLTLRMMDDDQMFDKYFYNYFKGANMEKYDLKRKTKILCSLMTSEVVDPIQCNLLKEITQKKRSLRSIGADFREKNNQRGKGH